MTHRLVGLGSLLMGVVLVASQAAGCAVAGADPAVVEAEVRAAEAARLAAFASKAPIDEYYHADFIGTGANGRRLDKAMAVSLRAAPSRVEVTSVRVLGDAALVVGNQAAAGTAQPQRFTRVWLQRDGRWQIAAAHFAGVSDSESPAVATRGTGEPADVVVTPTTTGAEDDILRAQADRDAMFVKRDAAAYDRQTAAAATRHRGNGGADAKPELMAEFTAGAGPGPVLTDRVARVYGDVALLFSSQGQPASQRATRVFVKEAGEWRYLHSAVSPIATAAPLPPDLRKAIDDRFAAQDARDLKAFAELTGDEYTVVNPEGVLLDKAGRLRELKGQQMTTTRPVRTEESAMVYGAAAVTRLRSATGYSATVWARKASGWQLVAAQLVNSPAGPSPAPQTPTSPGAEPEWTAAAGLSADEAAAFDAHVQIQKVGAAGDRTGYGRHTANEFVRIFPTGLVDRASMIDRITGRTGVPRDHVSVKAWDRVAVIRWRESGATPTWLMRVMVKNPWGWQQVTTISTNVAAPATR